MIAVVGGTGLLGRLVVTRLLADGVPVRVVARHAPEELPAGATFVAADVRRPESLPAAVADAEVVVSAVHGLDPAAGESPAEVDRDGNIALIAAARYAGADVVLVSIVGASAEHPIELMRMKAAAERALRDGAAGRPDWTVVRATAFAEQWADLLRQLAGGGAAARVLGRGENPMNFVAVADMATAVQRAALDPALRGQVIEVGGPDDLTMAEMARQVTGRATVRHVPRAALRVMGSLLAPVRPAQARLMRMALQMDSVPLRFDTRAARTAYPWLPCTPVAGAVHGQQARSG